MEPVWSKLQHELKEKLASIPAYRDLGVYLPSFWSPHPKGPLLKSHIYLMAAGEKSKYIGRLQATLCPEGEVRSEYVAFPVFEEDNTYHIQTIARLFGDADWRSALHAGLGQLPRGFRLSYNIMGGEREEMDVSEVLPETLARIAEKGLDTGSYFVIHHDRPRDQLLHLSVKELAELVADDWVDLYAVYPLLEGHSKKPGKRPCHTLSAVTATAKSKTRKPPDGTFNPEFDDAPASYQLTDTVQARRDHGKVVNALYEQINTMGARAGNDQQRDLYTLAEDGRMDVLFEVKTQVSPSNVYKAVGQLMLHGNIQDPPPRRVIVIPNRPKQAAAEAFKKLGIEWMVYGWDKEIATFAGLERFISVD